MRPKRRGLGCVASPTENETQINAPFINVGLVSAAELEGTGKNKEFE